MHQNPAIRNVIKLVAYPLPPDLSGSVVSPKVVLKQPVEFASALAHEVRNPLSNINLAVEILQSIAKDDEQKDYLDIILRSAAKINDLVTDLIAYYQTEELRPQQYSINKLLDEVLEKTVDRIMLKNITIIKDYTSIDDEICVDIQKIKIALTNIIINAIDAMPFENGKLRVITKSHKGKCSIEIEDNGIGISKENLNNIFKPYYTNKTGGMGLGLSTTVDILVSNYAGIDVHSQEGVGTTFILSFNKVL
jgi:signal transduction histidine kinase